VRAWIRRLCAAGAVAAFALATGGCGSGIYIGTEGDDPATGAMRCDRPSDSPSGMLVLLAQAVPTASAVPCLTAAIPNWLMSRFDVRDGSGLVEFTYRHSADDRVVIEVRPACDLGDAREVASRFDGMRRYNRTVTRAGRYADESYFVHPGGCTTLRFDIAGAGADLRGAEVAGELGFVTRADLDRRIRAASDDNLELDPPAGGG
jgi:hypothetical protein